MDEQLEQRVRAIVAATLQVPLEEVSGDTAAESTPAWDSLNHLNLMLALEQEFERQFLPEETERMTKVRDIVAVIRNRASS